MASALKDLSAAATRSGQTFDSLRQEVEQNKETAEKLLKKGRASGQVPSALLFRPALTFPVCWSQEASRAPGWDLRSAWSSSPDSVVPHQQVEKLLGRAEAARDVTNAALQGLRGSSEDLSAALDSLKGETTTVPPLVSSDL